MSVKQFFNACNYYEALVIWVNGHPDATYEEYLKARDLLRKEYDVEFVGEWRKE